MEYGQLFPTYQPITFLWSKSIYSITFKPKNCSEYFRAMIRIWVMFTYLKPWLYNNYFGSPWGKMFLFTLWNKYKWIWVIPCYNETNTVLALKVHSRLSLFSSSSTISTIIWYKPNIPWLLCAFKFPFLQM